MQWLPGSSSAVEQLLGQIKVCNSLYVCRLRRHTCPDVFAAAGLSINLATVKLHFLITLGNIKYFVLHFQFSVPLTP